MKFAADLRYAYRVLRGNPGFTAIAVLSLALGIGANTAIFSFINTVILRQLPVKNPEKLVLFGEGKRRGHSNGWPAESMDIFSWREYQDFKSAGAFADVLAASSYGQPVYPSFSGQRASGVAEPLDSSLVSGNYFDVLGVRPAAGRLFDPSMDVKPTPAVVLSDSFWERRFHRSSSVIGQTARIGTRAYTIVGVAQRGFFGIRTGISPDIWIPLSMQPYLPGQANWLNSPSDMFLNLIGRLKPGAGMAQAQSIINATFHQNMRIYLGNSPDFAQGLARGAKSHIEMTSGARGILSFQRQFATPLKILMWVVALVLAIAAANVANLVMALNAKRQKEFAVRTAIGANRAQLIRLVLTQSLLLSAAGGALGILIAAAGAQVLVHLISTGPRAAPINFDPDARVLAFTMAVSALTGILFGLAPALRGTNPDLNTTLKEKPANVGSPRKITFGRAMAVCQVALSMVLLVGAGLLLHSFENLINKPAGFDREHVLVAQIDTSATGYNGDQKLAALYDRIEQKIDRIPGVTSSAFCHRVFGEGQWQESFSVPGLVPSSAQETTAINFVGDDFFKTLGAPLLAGRTFARTDTASGQHVTVINQTMARSVFGGVSAIGRTIMMQPITDTDVPYLVIGIVPDTQDRNLIESPGKMAWAPLEQNPVFASDVVIRVSGDPLAVAPAVRQAIRGTDSNLPIRYFETLAEQVSDSLVTQRAVAQLAGFFAGVALFLAAMGLYGTISFSVTRRTGEIGTRMALGAEQSRVVQMVLSDAAKMLGAGMVAGLPLAFAAKELVHSVLYGIGAFDWRTLLMALAALTASAMLAGYLPARRAARVDPNVALRYE